MNYEPVSITTKIISYSLFWVKSLAADSEVEEILKDLNSITVHDSWGHDCRL